MNPELVSFGLACVPIGGRCAFPLTHETHSGYRWCAAGKPGFEFAEEMDTLPIAWTTETASWRPTQRLSPSPQPIPLMVFDQPIAMTGDLELVPGLLDGVDAGGAPTGL
ncbi:hypothetical protein FIU94_19880 (plasmid) [Sulfitobacter sp. THAF37]|nr:hypothetical protein FIU94_19880 [Sulfitobacter sp. THAF37]